MEVPEVFLKLNEGQSPVMTAEAPIHYNDVRLVVPMADPETGELKDTIVADIGMSRVFHDRRNDEFIWDRFIKGTEIQIPWPEKVEKEQHDMEGDTRIMHVETVTYTPTLLSSPFPKSVIDELRNRYSKFRTRHDPEFLARLRQEEEEAAARANMRVRTPINEFNKLRRDERKALGPPVITEAILEQIGKVMAKNKPELLEKIRTPQSQMDID